MPSGHDANLPIRERSDSSMRASRSLSKSPIELAATNDHEQVSNDRTRCPDEQRLPDYRHHSPDRRLPTNARGQVITIGRTGARPHLHPPRIAAIRRCTLAYLCEAAKVPKAATRDEDAADTKSEQDPGEHGEALPLR